MAKLDRHLYRGWEYTVNKIPETSDVLTSISKSVYIYLFSTYLSDTDNMSTYLFYLIKWETIL